MDKPWENDVIVPRTQGAIRTFENNQADRLTFNNLLRSRKLNTRDMNLGKQVFLTKEQLMWDEEVDRSPANLEELAKEIEMQKDPKRRAILKAEQERITAPFSNMLKVKP